MEHRIVRLVLPLLVIALFTPKAYATGDCSDPAWSIEIFLRDGSDGDGFINLAVGEPGLIEIVIRVTAFEDVPGAFAFAVVFLDQITLSGNPDDLEGIDFLDGLPDPWQYCYTCLKAIGTPFTMEEYCLVMGNYNACGGLAAIDGTVELVVDTLTVHGLAAGQYEIRFESGPRAPQVFSAFPTFFQYTICDPCKDDSCDETPGTLRLGVGDYAECADSPGPLLIQVGDCNENGIPDDQDIADGTSQDYNENGIPDDCEPDCNENAIPDDLDIADGTSQDCNKNAVPDECELASGVSQDCNENGILDECETQFSEQIISSAADGAQAIFVADLDGDGDNDVLSASSLDDKIAWYENIDGLGSFGSQQVITSEADNAQAIFVADLDGDGDNDVLSASWFDDKIAWYENTDGLGSFGFPQIITTGADGAESVFAADLDGDGDIDVFSASWYDNKIAWYENTDGLGNFGPQQIITTAAYGAAYVFAADLDGDGDNDVLSASNGKIAWYENTNGLGFFGPQRIITTGVSGAKYVSATDLDGDGDIDVLSASSNDDKIAWYENIDGLGSFGSQQVITSEADNAQAIFVADLDGDGDNDVLSASWFDDKIAWYENTDGLGSFGFPQIITTGADGAESVFAADLDGDGDIDVFSASWYDNKIAWYENTDGLGNFGPQQIITTTADGASSVFAADLEGDGDIEVLSASWYDDKIAWYQPPIERDCNGNEIPDECDIAEGTSLDCSGNGIPDECEPEVPCLCEGDANGDGVVDPLDSGFVLSRFGCSVDAGDPDCEAADQNGDGLVDPLDVGYVSARFGACR